MRRIDYVRKSLMRRLCSLHKRSPTTGSNTPRSELQDGSQRTRLRAHQSVSHISRVWRKRKSARRHSPTSLCHRKSCSQTLRNGMYCGKVSANVDHCNAALLAKSKTAIGLEERSEETTDVPRVCPQFTGAHEEDEHIIRCKDNFGKTCLVLGRRASRKGRWIRALSLP
jgi:hypothetical protein